MQTVPHMPQFALLVVVSMHTPLHIFSVAVGQVHAPATHDEPPPHGLLHAPQSTLLVMVLTHAPLQSCSGDVHPVVHFPSEQT